MTHQVLQLLAEADYLSTTDVTRGNAEWLHEARCAQLLNQ